MNDTLQILDITDSYKNLNIINAKLKSDNYMYIYLITPIETSIKDMERENRKWMEIRVNMSKCVIYHITGGSPLSRTAVKPDSRLARIFCQNHTGPWDMQISTDKPDYFLSRTDFHAPKKSGLSGTHLYFISQQYT